MFQHSVHAFTNGKVYRFIILLLFINMIFAGTAAAQTGVITGVVSDRNTLVPLTGVTVLLEGTDPLVGTRSAVDGSYRLAAPAGTYTVKASFVGYSDLRKYNVVLTSGNAGTVNFELNESPSTLDEVVVTGGRTAAVATIENPVSIQKLSAEEIKSNPGGNFDVSRVIQSLPGVSTSPGGVRNDIIIRGGAPNENVYYLDGIEVPVINHFSTQGSGGGPQGILNLSFIEDVTLNTSGFAAKYDNALSSVFQFKQREGNADRFQGNVRLSGTELATTFEGPISSKTTFLASARRSYLQYFFQLIDLPIRPSYWDFQFKVNHKLSDKTTLTAIGIGALDKFSFGVPKESSPEKEYALRANPIINQNSYTLGLTLRHLIEKGYFNIAVSRNYFDNQLEKFEDGNKDSTRTLRSLSHEIENKLRIDLTKNVNSFKYSLGASVQYVQYDNDLYNQVRKELRDDDGDIVQTGNTIRFNTGIDFFKYGFFAQLTKTFFDKKVSVSGGLRSDMNSFTADGNDPLQTLSPRMSLSYAVNDQWNINASIGRYYKIPTYTILGFKDDQGNFVNRDLRYIRSDHFVAGIEHLPKDDLRFTLEGFYKRYGNYPVSLLRGISLANEGADFGAIGNEQVGDSGAGRTFGVEFFVQKKLTRKTFYIFTYTWYRSEFSGLDGKFKPSSWDNQHLISALLGQKFKKGWELGVKFRLAGGAPYTPFDLGASRANYLSLGTGVQDLALLNSKRLDVFTQFDIRVDKKWNYRRLTLDVYFDFQNAFLTKTPTAPDYTFERNTDGSYSTIDGQRVKSDGSNAIPLILEDDDPFFVPTIGFIIEF